MAGVRSLSDFILKFCARLHSYKLYERYESRLGSIKFGQNTPNIIGAFGPNANVTVKPNFNVPFFSIRCNPGQISTWSFPRIF